MKEINVSVIIPVYNGEKTLEKCLDSILKQTYENYEIIVVDNNSTDNSMEIIKKFAKKYPKIVYAFEKIKRRGAARNAGIKKSKGSVIVMVDCDCVAPKDWLEKITKLILNGSEKIVMGFEDDLTRNFWTKNIQKANWNYIKNNLNGRYASHLDTKNFAVSDDVMKKFMFDNTLGNMEDFDLYLRIKNKIKIRFSPEISVGHYHKNSFFGVVKSNIDRAYWTFKIYKKHKGRCNIREEPMFGSISVKNFFLFPFWAVMQFFKRPFGEAYFIFVSEVSWRIGLLLAVF